MFNLPEDVTEQAFLSAIQEINDTIKNMGYPYAGYELYKVTTDTINEYQYFMEGKWKNPANYDSIHNKEAYKKVIDKHRQLIEKTLANQIYRRVSKINPDL